MKIAVTYENGQIFQHFGHTAQFKVYRIERKQIVETSMIDATGSGHCALVELLQANNIDVLICGGIGGGAKNALENSGIELLGGVSGRADNAVLNYIEGILIYSTEATCTHHDEHHHDCGEHGHDCGEHEHHCGEHQ